MELEHKLLSAAIYDREAFEDLLSFKAQEGLSDKGKVVWEEVSNFYDKDGDATKVERDVLISRIERKFPKHAKALNQVIETLEPVSIPNLMEEVITLRKHAIANELAIAFASGNEKHLDELLDAYNELRRGEIEEGHKPPETYSGVKVTDIVARDGGENRVKLLPTALNEHIGGGVLKKHHIVVFAPTDMGKSLFVLNMLYGFAKQGLRVLYGGNEDPIQDIIMRSLWRFSGMSKEELIKNPDKADEQARNNGYENVIFAELGPGNEYELRELIEEHKPDVLIVDQIRNLDMGEKNNFVRTLEKAAQMMRKFGKKYNIVPVSLSQAADSATNKALLGRGDIDNSNVGIPGTADLLIGIGASAEMEATGQRMISFVKNKINGNKEPLRVTFIPEKTKVI